MGKKLGPMLLATSVVVESDDYIVLNLNGEGGYRFGIKGTVFLDIPTGHKLTDAILNVISQSNFDEAAEEFAVEMIECGNIDPRVF